MQLIVYCARITPRVEYIFSTLLNAIGVNNFQLTEDVAFFNNSTGYKINYSTAYVREDILWIDPVTLLFENDIQKQPIEIFSWKGTKVFFKSSNGDLPFDIFAASFYLITRYEEYLPYKVDTYGRYAHENSIAYKSDFLCLPLVNLWLKEFCTLLKQAFPFLYFDTPGFRFLPTYDIDIAFSYSHKGYVRNAGGLLRAMAEGEWARASERINVLFGNQKDPFDSYEWLDELHEKYHLKPIYFFLVAPEIKGYDKNILPSKKAVQKLMQKHSAAYHVGVHPSWQSGDTPELLQQEIETLATITGNNIHKSRQHYIRMTLPETYRRLMQAGISEDYTMGYGSINGFRASYCLPYLWYNLQKEEITSLTIYPFCYMDANSYFEQHLSGVEALKEMQHYYNVTKEVNGLFITIWHNHFLGTDKMFEGWKEIYSTMVDRIYNKD
ncbi:MAG: hypothetical protein JWQ40_5223 [Segetibacter sp.]|nr:hypothetical protein [Segetibacter sp.]